MSLCRLYHILVSEGTAGQKDSEAPLSFVRDPIAEPVSSSLHLHCNEESRHGCHLPRHLEACHPHTGDHKGQHKEHQQLWDPPQVHPEATDLPNIAGRAFLLCLLGLGCLALSHLLCDHGASLEAGAVEGALFGSRGPGVSVSVKLLDGGTRIHRASSTIRASRGLQQLQVLLSRTPAGPETLEDVLEQSATRGLIRHNHAVHSHEQHSVSRQGISAARAYCNSK